MMEGSYSSLFSHSGLNVKPLPHLASYRLLVCVCVCLSEQWWYGGVGEPGRGTATPSPFPKGRPSPRLSLLS